MDALTTALTALAGAPTQHARLLRLHTAFGPDVLVAETLEGHECVDGDGFRFDLTALSADAHLELSELLGQPVLLELLTARSRHELASHGLRPLHGHVTAFERVGSNGGLARYRLVIEPWLAFLRQRVDSWVFQDMTVVEIVESVFADYAGQGRLVPAWRWDLRDPAVYRKLSLCTQYEESDFDFLQRLLAEEGIHTHFEHAGDAGSESRGRHTLVLADHGEAFADLGPVRFHRRDATEREDAIQHWSTARRWQPLQLRRASWDYRANALRVAEAGAATGEIAITDEDIAPYAWPDRATGERRARRHLEALQVATATVHGAGSWRCLRPGTGFELAGHPGHRDPDASRFICLRVQHRARNNLGAEVLGEAEKRLGPVLAAAPALPAVLTGLAAPAAAAAAPGRGEAGVPGQQRGDYFYDNRFEALPAGVPYRPRTIDGHGVRLHPRPTAPGIQTAIVVGDGAPVLTDRDHRIKLQFPWQRGSDASSRLGHPSGDDNARGNADAWTWVRVATAWAGDNWGSVLLPRVGQEVLVAFLEGDIDRPVVVGTVYNGRGQEDAPHNQVGAGAAGATANAPAWFEGNDHASVFTGFKTQALADSPTGTGGYQQLRLDDTPGQGRAQASTTQHATTLTLGHLKAGEDNVRGAERGFGAELSSHASGALRAGAGLLLTTEPGPGQLDADGARSQLAASEQLLASLDDTARAQLAGLPDEPAALRGREALVRAQEHLAATHTGHAPGDGIAGGDGEAPAWSAPLLVASSPAGIASVTPADQVWVSGTQATLTADHDLHWLSQGETVVAVGGGIALYSHGTAAPSGKPNQETGIALHAAQGAVSARAHRNRANVAAKTRVTIASTQADVAIAAPAKHVLVTAAGAYLKLEGGNIELGAPGAVEFKGAKKEWAGAQGAGGQAPVFGEAEPGFCERTATQADAGGAAIVRSD